MTAPIIDGHEDDPLAATLRANTRSTRLESHLHAIHELQCIRARIVAENRRTQWLLVFVIFSAIILACIAGVGLQ